MLSANEIYDWIVTEKPGAVLCYFVGSFAKAADQDFVFVPPKGGLKIPMKTTAEIKAAQNKH